MIKLATGGALLISSGAGVLVSIGDVTISAIWCFIGLAWHQVWPAAWLAMLLSSATLPFFKCVSLFFLSFTTFTVILSLSTSLNCVSLQLDSQIWPVIFFHLGLPHCRLKNLWKLGKSGADRHVVDCMSGLPCPRFGISVTLSALQDFNCFVGTLGLEFSYWMRFVNPRRQLLCCTIQVKPLWFIDFILATTTRGLCEIRLDCMLVWLTDVTKLQWWWWWWWWWPNTHYTQWKKNNNKTTYWSHMSQ